MGVTHSKVSTIDDGPDTDLVRPSDWNDDHVVTGLAFGLVVDGGGSAITTGIKGYQRMPDGGTITGWYILASGSGSAVIDIWKGTLADHTANTIDSSDTITASARPTLTSARAASSTTLTGWTTTFSAGDVFWFNVVSVNSVTWVNLEIQYMRS